MSSNKTSLKEKNEITTPTTPESRYDNGVTTEDNEEFEVFKKTNQGVDFRTVGWPRAAIIFLKVQFALGVLSIPTAMYSLGALGGALSVVGWGALNTCMADGAVIQGDFRTRHAGCHNIADMAYVLGGKWMREICGGLFVIAYVLCTGAGIVGVATGLNALSHHAACTVWWSLIATIVIASCSSFQKLHTIGWLTWAGFASIFVSVMIVVIAVTTLDRPAAAPQTGDFALGYHAIANPTFIAGMTATATIFISSSGSSAFLPVIAEMKNPNDYRKALFVCMGFVNAAYLSISLVVYRWCGQYVANPSLGSAGQTVKMIAYGIGLIGLIVSAVIYLHVAAKYCFVRLLRNSEHLQANTTIHWATWIGCTFSLAALSFILAESIPIFSYLIALTGSICFAPLALVLPALFWVHDHSDWRQSSLAKQIAYYSHWLMLLLGVFLTVAGTYATVQNITDAYAAGSIGSAFSCADTSNSS